MAATFEALVERTHNFGRNAYIEVARKRLCESDAASEFFVISRGFYESDGTKRWTKFVTLPDDKIMREFLAKALLEL